MGRITIFSLDECPHCLRTKAALKDREIPFTEISLSSYPNKRSDMLSLADQLTVPQVFFNDTHIGGANDTLAELDKWDGENRYTTPLERFEKEIESQPDPTDARLAIPIEPPHKDAPPPARNVEEDSIAVPSEGKIHSVLDMTLILMCAMPKNDLSYRGKVYKNSFKGEAGVSALMERFSIKDRKDAVALGKLLQKRQIIHHVCDDHKFGDNEYYFRLQPYHVPKVINTFRVWTDRVDPNPVALIHRLKKMLGQIESRATDGEGKVNYFKAVEDRAFWTFEEAVCELQGVDMAKMDGKTKLAFGINLYNLMIIHAFMKVGIPASSPQRGSFFGTVSYNIGGHVMSFSEVENGVLRSNSKAPYSFSTPFSSSDPRLALICDKVDPRIHFGLNCGAKSCPPVKKFTVQAIEEELRIVAQAFCEQEDNVRVDEEKGELHLNMILSWYKSDFAPSTSKLPENVITFLRGGKKDALQKMIDQKKGIKVKFNTYDWGTNASASKKYNSSSLRNTAKFLSGMCMPKEELSDPVDSVCREAERRGTDEANETEHITLCINKEAEQNDSALTTKVTTG
mmetsp:Transcript_542/g.1657  ORF Transcript_542/g.1657 Transcript_542/m.1657 type:complete len:569 (-) Transcript_542:28-1734(-)